MKHRIVLLVVVVLTVLSGCINYPVSKNGRGQEIPGPLALNGNRPSILGGCRTINSYWGTCDLIFTDLNGRRQDGYRLAKEIDGFASKLPQLAQWANLKDRDRSQAFPYEMFLLTISPEIVLVVPRENATNKGCPSVYENGCIQSLGFYGNSYWYIKMPKVVPGSFWFSPQSNGFTVIKDTDSEVLINVDRAIVRLTSSSGEWRVSRER